MVYSVSPIRAHNQEDSFPVIGYGIIFPPGKHAYEQHGRITREMSPGSGMVGIERKEYDIDKRSHRQSGQCNVNGKGGPVGKLVPDGCVEQHAKKHV